MRGGKRAIRSSSEGFGRARASAWVMQGKMVDSGPLMQQTPCATEMGRVAPGPPLMKDKDYDLQGANVRG